MFIYTNFKAPNNVNKCVMINTEQTVRIQEDTNGKAVFELTTGAIIENTDTNYLELAKLLNVLEVN